MAEEPKVPPIVVITVKHIGDLVVTSPDTNVKVQKG